MDIYINVFPAMEPYTTLDIHSVVNLVLVLVDTPVDLRVKEVAVSLLVVQCLATVL